MQPKVLSAGRSVLNEILRIASTIASGSKVFSPHLSFDAIRQNEPRNRKNYSRNHDIHLNKRMSTALCPPDHSSNFVAPPRSSFAGRKDHAGKQLELREKATKAVSLRTSIFDTSVPHLSHGSTSTAVQKEEYENQ